MIQPVRQPRALRAGALRALHLALNSPVVTHEALPSGPAAAAVALDAEGALVCLRSLRDGHTAFFVSSETLVAEPQLALDAALAFTERLGFVFDHDALAQRGESVALRLWLELCGDAIGVAEPEPEDADELELEREPLEHDELDDEDLELDDATPWPAVLLLGALPAAEPLQLSKFRFFAAQRQEESR